MVIGFRGLVFCAGGVAFLRVGSLAFLEDVFTASWFFLLLGFESWTVYSKVCLSAWCIPAWAGKPASLTP